MAGDGMHISEYDPTLADAILGEAAHLLRNLGFSAQHAILIGGLVPGLLVLDPGPGRSRHVGTADLDICLSVALIEGGTAEYERIEKALRTAGFEPTDRTFAWRRTHDLGVVVEFFCPASEKRPPGTVFRPKADEAPLVKHNMGGRLSAIALEAGNAISHDIVAVEREVVLPDSAGHITWTFRVTGLVGFLVAKASALVDRDKPKDAYDIVWLLENWESGPEGASEAVAATGLLERDDVRSAMTRLATAFSAPDGLGPSSFVRFMAPTGAPQDVRVRLARQAMGAVQAFIEALDDAQRG